jgi:hypothetical protein
LEDFRGYPPQISVHIKSRHNTIYNVQCNNEYRPPHDNPKKFSEIKILIKFTITLINVHGEEGRWQRTPRQRCLYIQETRLEASRRREIHIFWELNTASSAAAAP